ncbi:hypothetical protein F4802DRAFT_190186 [Xylaria palmicola]|nr:hypothetical protein F4802DRAFT_190186 [Xylaria palmicola]
MDGDWGYQLMSSNVPPEVMIGRNQQPPRRKQAKTWKISTWTAAVASASAASSSRTTSSTLAALASPPIITTSTGTATAGALEDNLTTTISTDGDITSANTGTDTNANTTADTSTSTNTRVEAIAGAGTETNTNTNATPAPPDDPDRARGPDRHLVECDNPSSPEQSTAVRRPRLFGRSSRRRATSPARSSTSDLAHARTSSSNCSSPPGPAHSDHSLPAAPRATTASLPSFATFATRPAPDGPGLLQSSHLTDDPAPRQSHAPWVRLHRRDRFQRRSTHHPLLISPSAQPPLRSPTEGAALHHPLGDMPSPRSSGFTSQSGVMRTSNEILLSSSADRSGSLSIASNATSTTSKPAGTTLRDSRAFIVRNGRTYINDPTVTYPLPVDLPELHRQSLRTLLMFQLFGGPILSTVFASRPPTRVLDVGCGAGFWSMMCHRYFAQHGHSNISFTGLDIVPLGGAGAQANTKPDKEMRWNFVQHDMRQIPWPFADGEFDLVIVKEVAFAAPARDAQGIMEECLRITKPGGVLEYWETDSLIRMLRPHATKSSSGPAGTAVAASSETPRDDDDDDTSSDGGDDEDPAERMGAYVMTKNTPISQPANLYLIEYNGWASKALEARGLSAAPCTSIGPNLLMEAESLTDVQSKRLAVPLSEIRWEREGVGGVVTKDGKSYIDSHKGKFRADHHHQDAKAGSGNPVLSAQLALRRTALETTVSFILALEPLLREVSGKSQEEWDTWAGKMTNDLLREGGTSWGECLEVGVWTARKRHSKS